MSHWLAVILPLALAHFAAAASPGPSFVVIARTALARSRTAAMRMSVGLGLGAALWAGAALFGLTLLFQWAPWTLAALKIAGGLFLLWVAISLWRHAGDPVAITPAGNRNRTPLGDVRHGFLVQVSNPKVSIFFGSVFVTLLPPDAPGWLLATLLGVVFTVETLWYVAVSNLLALGPVQSRYLRVKTWIDRGCGAVLGTLGLGLATS